MKKALFGLAGMLAVGGWLGIGENISAVPWKFIRPSKDKTNEKEADLVAKGASVYRGKRGELVASPRVTRGDDGTMAREWGTLTIDDAAAPSATLTATTSAGAAPKSTAGPRSGTAGGREVPLHPGTVTRVRAVASAATSRKRSTVASQENWAARRRARRPSPTRRAAAHGRPHG